MRTTCIIPARGGSVRIPGKNKRMFHGKPIILYSIETAQKSRLFDSIVVSTDDEEIAGIARRNGCLVHWREPDDGTRGTQEVAADVLRSHLGDRVGIACVLYATAPLLEWESLVEGYQGLLARTCAWGYSYLTDVEDHDVGQFYWGFAAAFLEHPEIDEGASYAPRTFELIDINTEDDWQLAERMYTALQEGK